MIKYRKGITLDEAMEIVEELLPHYSGSNTYTNGNIISLELYEQSNLFQTTEMYEVIMNGRYDGDDGLREKRDLNGYVNIVFYENKLEVMSWYQTSIDGLEERTYDVNCLEEHIEIQKLILANKNFEEVGK